MGKNRKNKKGNKKMNFEKVYGILFDARKSKKDAPAVKSAQDSAAVFTAGGYGGYSASCHTGAKLAFTDPVTGQKYFGGGYSRDFDRVENSILIALDDIVLDTVIVGNIPNIPRSFVDTIFIKWADYSIPLMEKGDWLQLLTALQSTGKDVSIACMGGHGRTGTALAILGYFCGAIQEKPVEYIQKNYCYEAIESWSQYDYIRKMTGVDEMGSAPPTTNRYIPAQNLSNPIRTNFINGFNPDQSVDILECKVCAREMFQEEAIFVGNDPYCEFCIRDGVASKDETCTLCGVSIDSSVEVSYVIGGNLYCELCEGEIKE